MGDMSDMGFALRCESTKNNVRLWILLCVRLKS